MESFRKKTKAKLGRTLKVDSDRSHLRSTEFTGNGKPAKNDRAMHSYTDGRSTAMLNNLTQDVTRSKNGLLAVNENGKVNTKNAETNLFTDKDKGKQSGTRRDKQTGKITSKGNRRQRDYYVRVGLNNDQRSPEAMQRLRDTYRSMGMSEAEINAELGGGRGSAGSGWGALATG